MGKTKTNTPKTVTFVEILTSPCAVRGDKQLLPEGNVREAVKIAHPPLEKNFQRTFHRHGFNLWSQPNVVAVNNNGHLELAPVTKTGPFLFAERVLSLPDFEASFCKELHRKPEARHHPGMYDPQSLRYIYYKTLDGEAGWVDLETSPDARLVTLEGDTLWPQQSGPA